MTFNEKIRALMLEKEIPYLDILVCKNYDVKLRFTSEGAVGNERLQLFSMSKGITVTAVLRLIEEGKLSFDTKVCELFPEFEKTYYMQNGKLLENSEAITVKHLITMSSGLSYDVTDPAILSVTEKKGQSALLKDYVPAFAKMPLSFPVGKSFQYGLSHDLLAAIVEKVTGVPFDEYVRDALFIPLGMKDSTFTNTECGIFEKLVCNEDKSITSAPVHNDLLFSEKYVSGGAGMISTVQDYSIFVSALANGGVAKNGYRILSSDTVRLLSTPVLDHDFVKHDFNWQGDDYGYGYGVRVRERDTDWGLTKGEFGWDGATGGFWLVDPKNKISVVIGMNILSWERRFVGLHIEIMKEIYRELGINDK